MGFKLFSKIAVALGVVLVIVVLLEFLLLTFYVKESDSDFPKAVESASRFDRIINHVTKDSGNISTSSNKESKPEREQVSYKPTKR